jgi:DNA-binding beta-propeller fold protein YncE
MMEPLALPGASAPVSLDYLFFESQPARVWVPAGGTGSVAVFDVAARSFSRVEGFKTLEREMHGKKRALGPSSGVIGDGVAYVGNRATQEVCVIDLQTLKTRACLKLASAPDGVEYCRATREVWATTPNAQSITVLDAAKPGVLKQKSIIKLEGAPEGYAVDAARGVFLTNLEDKGSTLAIDLQTHAVKEVWNAGCSSDGPRGIAVDSARGLVMVACTDHVQVLDAKNKGALLGKLDAGAGVDNLDYVESAKLLYAAAGKAARLTVARLEDNGQLTVTASGDTAPGARNAVADASGNAYVADPQGARLLLLSAAKH